MRYSCYERLIKLITDCQLFQKGDIFNQNIFQQQLIKKQLLPTFHYYYTIDTNSSGVWSMFDFSDRFNRFAKALCESQYCSKIKAGTYIKT